MIVNQSITIDKFPRRLNFYILFICFFVNDVKLNIKIKSAITCLIASF